MASVSAGMAAWDNECAGWLALGDAEEAAGIYEVGRFDEFIWARPVPGGRPRLPVMLLVVRADGSAQPRGEAARLKQAVDTFGLAGTPVYLALPPEGPIEGWQKAARRLGFRHESVQILMACPLPRPAPAAPPARFAVAEAKDDEQWRQALAVIGEVYGDPENMTAFYNPRDKVRLFVARVNEEPVSAAALWPFAGVAGIYSVATKPRFRRLGLAYAVVEHVLAVAEKEGFDRATLRTTGDLLAVYFRHGFGVAGQVHRYRLDL